MTTVDTAQSWETARRISELIKPFPSSVTTCVRFIKADADKNLEKCTKTSQYGLLRFLKSPSFKSPLYYAALTFRGKQIESLSKVTDYDIINVFRPGDLMVLTPLLYLYRKIRRGCDPQEFALLSGPLQRYTDLGGLVGQVVPGIGFGPGILAGAMRYLGLAMLLGIDKASFGKYRRKLKNDNKLFDIEDELSMWGTNHIHIASLLTQTLGIGQDYGDAIARGLVPTTGINASLPALALAVQAGSIWIEALGQTCKVPQMMMKAEHYPSQADLEILLNSAESMYNEGSRYDWLQKGKDDISPEKTPQLFGQDTAPKGELSEPADESVPEDIIDEINVEDLEKLE